MWWVTFGASVAGEIRKTRPAVVISNNAANTVLKRVIVVPLTSKVDRVYPGEALVVIEGQRSKAMSDQMTTAAKMRLKNRFGVLSDEDLGRVEDAILFQLGIRR